MIGIIGFGRFGRLAAGCLARDFKVYVACGRDAQRMRIEAAGALASDLDSVCRQKILILCVPISAMQMVLADVAPRIPPGTLVVDVCSVKQLPVQWMRRILPEHARILGTHPMFGPDSAEGGLGGHKIVLCPVRIPGRQYKKIKDYLGARGLKVIEADPGRHDREIAVSLALTHYIGRALDAFGACPMPIDTEGYKRLLNILGVVTNDTWQLFYDMHRYNPYAADQRRAFRRAMEKIERKLGKSG